MIIYNRFKAKRLKAKRLLPSNEPLEFFLTVKGLSI